MVNLHRIYRQHRLLRVAQVQLSTYGDSLGKDLKDLKTFIDNNLEGDLPAALLSMPPDAFGLLHPSVDSVI